MSGIWRLNDSPVAGNPATSRTGIGSRNSGETAIPSENSLPESDPGAAKSRDGQAVRPAGSPGIDATVHPAGIPSLSAPAAGQTKRGRMPGMLVEHQLQRWLTRQGVIKIRMRLHGGVAQRWAQGEQALVVDVVERHQRGRLRGSSQGRGEFSHDPAYLCVSSGRPTPSPGPGRLVPPGIFPGVQDPDIPVAARMPLARRWKPEDILDPDTASA